MTGFVKGLITGTFTTLAAIGSYRVIIKDDNTDTKSFQSKEKKVLSIIKYGIPDRGPEFHQYENLILAYDQAKKIPVWVAEYITKDHTKGSADRKNIRFKPDPNIPTRFSADNSDYLGSGWSRGHMAPAGDNKHSNDAMKETFYLSNILPQNYENNAGFWNRLECYCRDLTKTFKGVQIFSGPLFLPEADEDGNKFIKYPIIGKHDVTVPTHLYKVIIVENDLSEPVGLGAFIIPNKPVGYDHTLKDFQVDLDDLESSVGVSFMPKLDTKGISDLCKVDSCKLMGREKFELYMIGRKLQGARTLKFLEKVWSELDKKELKPDQFLIDLYNNRKMELLYKEKVEGKNKD